MTHPQAQGGEQGARRASMFARVSMLIGHRRPTIVALAVCSIFAGFTEAATLALVAELGSALVTGKNSVHLHAIGLHFHSTIGTLITIAFGLTLLRTLLQVPLSLLPARIASDVQAGVRNDLFQSFSRASWAIQSRDREGQLQETMTSQAMQATGGALQATLLIISSFTFLVLMASAIALNPRAAVLVGGTSTALFALLRPLRATGVRNARGLSRAQVRYASGVAEAIRVAEDTQVFGVVAAQRSHIETLVQASQGFYYRMQVITRLVSNLYQSLIYLLLVAGIAGLYYLASRSQAGELGGVVLVLLRAGTSGQLVQSAYQSLAQSLPFIERTQEAMRRYNESAQADGERPLETVEALAFENVSYSYNPGQPVLSEISFEVAGRQSVGIIGPSGAGKSTLVQLLLQLRIPETGSYLVNGTPAEQFTRADWHRQVSYVPQEPRLLHASVADNIRYLRDIDDESVERAARLARIHDDIMTWSDGYETIVGPRADAVSGGQQQRICLARALAARPGMLVLDEPTSALDPQSEMLIGESLTALKSELMLFIIAHRMSTLDICDRVMVIVDGRLVAFDTKALLQQENTYYRHASALAAGAAGSESP